MATVERSSQDAAGAMFRYAWTALSIGAGTVAAFAVAAFAMGDAETARFLLAAGAAAQWLAFLLIFPGTWRAISASSAAGHDTSMVARLLIGAALAEAGWIMLFLALMLAAFTTPILEPLGLAPELWAGVGILAFMVPGTVVLLAAVFSAKGASNAR